MDPPWRESANQYPARANACKGRWSCSRMRKGSSQEHPVHLDCEESCLQHSFTLTSPSPAYNCLRVRQRRHRDNDLPERSVWPLAPKESPKCTLSWVLHL